MNDKSKANAVVILSHQDEKTTNTVIDYLDWYNSSFIRINEEDTFESVNIFLDNHDEQINLKGKLKKIAFTNDIKYWYRRGDFSIVLPVKSSEIESEYAKNFLLQEWDFIKKFLHSHRKSLSGYYQEVENNKLLNLKLAKEVNFTIPATLITSEKQEALLFIKRYHKVITKPIHNAHIAFRQNDVSYSSTGTREVSLDNLNNLGDTFCPMMLQEHVEKEIEIRVFFIENKLYPMAIFSQSDEKTKLDYRNYNYEKPNRNVPFKIPFDVKKKVLSFIKKSGLSTGSIDLILSDRGEYIFLEVNPTGQFGWVSENCNYYLEQKVAFFLINMK